MHDRENVRFVPVVSKQSGTFNDHFFTIGYTGLGRFNLCGRRPGFPSLSGVGHNEIIWMERERSSLASSGVVVVVRDRKIKVEKKIFYFGSFFFLLHLDVPRSIRNSRTLLLL